ncbi:GNAT family N-acetyltransferase [Hymenobacter chitinivorans]|uniref:Ribosomal-protein-alanine N-acetyltransferase n=1 Tax=Hymenobacter chitinivorans DSM 11115 TaxID=1121954 RepID=A0A2M9ARK5_9BACT|nr:GNAT family N-acetyltransferase [Hymenobacter chitinivorans]PJJ48322.1 ribosomal-protein-alanine N-acetyltransferase [Hymenobacter chitinivorans DSM 11115]
MLQFQLTPFPVLTTPRLLLRELTPDDAEAIRFFRSDEEFLRYIPREKQPELAQAQAHLRLLAELLASNQGIAWALCRPEQPTELLGTICLWNLQPEHHRAEVGYGLHPHYAGQGLMTEALQAVISYGFDQLRLHSIEAQLDPANAASVSLLRKHGFVQEAYFRENYLFRDKYLDGAVYSLLTPHQE